MLYSYMLCGGVEDPGPDIWSWKAVYLEQRIMGQFPPAC